MANDKQLQKDRELLANISNDAYPGTESYCRELLEAQARVTRAEVIHEVVEEYGDNFGDGCGCCGTCTLREVLTKSAEQDDGKR